MQRISLILQRMLPVLLLFTMAQASCQDAEAGRRAPATWEHDHRHLLDLGFGFTFIPLGDKLEDYDARGLFTPTLGLDYFHRFTRRWGAGFMGNYELDHYVVTDDRIERENALLLTFVGLFSATKYLDLFLGGGIELEQHDNLGIFRFGAQYTIGVGEHWAIVPKLHFDFKENYDTWSFVLSFARKF